MSPDRWLREARADLAAEQILDAAGALFVERGVRRSACPTSLPQPGARAPPSTATSTGGDALRTAFVHRETRRIGARVTEAIAGVDDPRDRLVQAMTASLRLVRAEPTLVAWFGEDDAGTTASLARSSTVIEGLVAAFLGDSDDPTTRRRARWVVRILVSLLADPEADPDDERALIEAFVVPAVLTTG